MKLTPKQELFITEYMKDLNATQAAIRAGYKEENARQIGAENLSKPYIKSEIDKRLKQLTEQCGVTAEMVIREIAKIGFANITDYLKVDDFEYIAGYENDEDGKPDYDKPIKKTYRGVEVFKTENVALEKLSAVGEIRQTKDGISLKMHDKMKALEMLGRNLKLFTDKVEANVEGSQQLNINFNIPRPKKV